MFETSLSMALLQSYEQGKHWLDLPEIPLADELMSSAPPPLPLNDIDSRPQQKLSYLQTQYLLHRYEATELLRRAIAGYRQSHEPDGKSDVVVYHEVRSRIVPLRC